jgi:hypothetical protein
MARIVVGSYMVRYPLGGMLSWSLQWLVGLQRLGHEVYMAEKGHYANSCFDPTMDAMIDDCFYGAKTVNHLLERFNLHTKWCFVDFEGQYYGLSKKEIEGVLRSADLFLDIGSHGAWLEEAAGSGMRVLVDGEPAHNQMKMEKSLAMGRELPCYDFYYTNGAHIGTERSTAPTAGRAWRPVYNPVVTDLFSVQTLPPDASFTTVMNWQAHAPIEFQGKSYGMKDMEFEKFISLPRLVDVPLEISASGSVPHARLKQAGWRLRYGPETTTSQESYLAYIAYSAGEFSVCKNVYVETNSGWFSDRSAAYLASGRPVVLQETGFSECLPCGEGLFAVRTVEEAASALEKIQSNYELHSHRAREIAVEHLDAQKIIGRLISELGL